MNELVRNPHTDKNNCSRYCNDSCYDCLDSVILPFMFCYQRCYCNSQKHNNKRNEQPYRNFICNFHRFYNIVLKNGCKCTETFGYNKKGRPMAIHRSSFSDLGGIQTHNLLIRSQMLYSVELRGLISLTQQTVQ